MKAVLVLAGLVLTLPLWAQDAPKFEVASVKVIQMLGGMPGVRSGTGGCQQSFKMDRGRVEVGCTFLPELIGYAFRISPGRIAGPDWMTGRGAPVLDISATIPAGASLKQVPEMLRGLLAERFKLAVHRGTQEKEVLALVVAKSGPKLAEAAEPSPQPAAAAEQPDQIPFGEVETRTIVTPDGGHTTVLTGPEIGQVRQIEGPDRTRRWEAAGITPGGLAGLLDMVGPWEPPVVDQTGLKGRFQIVLEVSIPRRGDPADMEADLVRAFNDGLRKLGLQLERRRGSVETLVIDHVEKTPVEN